MIKRNIIKSIILILIFSLFFSHFIAIGYSNEVGITNGMVIKHIHSLSMAQIPEEVPTTLTFSKTSDVIMHADWKWGGSWDETSGDWDVNVNTRLVSNVFCERFRWVLKRWSLRDGSHNLMWIHTNVSLNDQVIIFNFCKDITTAVGDTIFNITGEAMHGSMEVWELEDAYGSVCWYEKARGFLVNGTFRYLTDWEIFEFESVEYPQPNPGIPGYNYFFVVSIISIISIVLIKKKSIGK
ncbi:MAG: hypothetical protein ACFFBC_08045 [Promethearchaeota archaeon]